MLVKKSDAKPQQKSSILFVCTGNICRSPMAEYWLRHLIQSRHLPCSSFSAGVMGCVGTPASATAREVMLEIGIDMSDHFGRQLNSYLVSMSDIILVMEDYHRETIDATNNRILLLGSFDPEGGPKNIADPYGKSPEEYRFTRDRIIRCIDAFADIMLSTPLTDASTLE